MNCNEVVKYRNELKYCISEQQAIAVSELMNMICVHDRFCDEHGRYYIKSTYFDTVNDDFYYDTLAGINIRHKYRIRSYNMDKSYIRFEKKATENGLKYKASSELDYAQYIKIIEGDCNSGEVDSDVLKNFLTESEARVIRPIVNIGYYREAFVYQTGNVRITIDSDIRASYNIFSLFDVDESSVSILNDPCLRVLEIKYDEGIPMYIRDMINSLGICDQVSFSKYVNSRRRLEGEVK